MFSIRAATKLDRDDIREVHLLAFSEVEGQVVAKLASNLLDEETTPETLALVAELDGIVVAHIAFSPVTFDDNEKLKGYILAPLGVMPEYQKCSVGSDLIKSSIEKLSEQGVNVLFVYGNPKYYGKFGFKAETATNYLPPYELQYPFGWLAIALNDDVYAEKTIKISCVPSLQDSALW